MSVHFVKGGVFFAGRSLGLCLLFLVLLFGTGETVRGEETSEGASSRLTGSLLEEMEFDRVQSMLDSLLGQDSFSFTEALKSIMTGEEILSKETVRKILYGLFFSAYEKEKDTLLKVLLLVFAAAIFFNFASVFQNNQIGEVSFYIVYLLLFTILMDSFSELSRSLEYTLLWMADFMQALSPAYFLAVTASSGAATAAVFYQGVLMLVWGIQWLIVNLFLPGANLYILLRLVNHLSREEMLGKLSELTGSTISWGLKTLLGVVAGLQVVKNLVAPVIDSLKRTALGKTASAIPGVGNAVNMVTQLVVTSAVLVRNSLGAVILVALVLAGIRPALRFLVMSFSYRFMAALTQPVSDRRLVEALSTMGEGCSILLRILLTADILCMLVFVILMASFGGGI